MSIEDETDFPDAYFNSDSAASAVVPEQEGQR